MVQNRSRSPVKVHDSIFCAACHDDVVIFEEIYEGLSSTKSKKITLDWNIQLDFF